MLTAMKLIVDCAVCTRAGGIFGSQGSLAGGSVAIVLVSLNGVTQVQTGQWGIVFFAARETPQAIRRSVDAALLAAPGPATIDVMVNGSLPLADALTQGWMAPDTGLPQVRIRVWSIPHGDKANAWNQYVHHIWSSESLAFFLDGYVQPRQDALILLGQAVSGRAAALGGSGVPTQGRSASTLRANFLVNGGFHGNLCCIKGDVLQRLKQRNIRLPVGLYRTDSLMGALLAYDLDPSTRAWDDDRIVVHPEATWRFDAKPGWHIATLQGHWSRRQRQARGALENAAFSNHLAKRRLLPEQLPPEAKELVLNWVRMCPADAQRVLRFHPLRWWALRKLREQQPVDYAVPLPVLRWDSSAQP